MVRVVSTLVHGIRANLTVTVKPARGITAEDSEMQFTLKN
jgi:hypothetical protein